jgi:hypothetical protein
MHGIAFVLWTFAPMDVHSPQCPVSPVLWTVPVCSGSQLPLAWCIGHKLRDHNSWSGALKDRGNI